MRNDCCVVTNVQINAWFSSLFLVILLEGWGGGVFSFYIFPDNGYHILIRVNNAHTDPC